MSGPPNPPSDDDWGGAEGDEWRQPQQPQQPPPQQPPPVQPGYQNAPPPPPPYGGQQGQPGQGGPPPQNIPNYLVHSILATLFCCLPTGIAGIVFASQVNSKLAMGDVAGAQKASENARLWTMISVGVGLVVIVLYFILLAIAGSP
jgi:hypothetical protein